MLAGQYSAVSAKPDSTARAIAAARDRPYGLILLFAVHFGRVILGVAMQIRILRPSALLLAPLAAIALAAPPASGSSRDTLITSHVAQPARAEPAWQELAPKTSPPRTIGADMVYDSAGNGSFCLAAVPAVVRDRTTRGCGTARPGASFTPRRAPRGGLIIRWPTTPFGTRSCCSGVSDRRKPSATPGFSSTETGSNNTPRPRHRRPTARR